MPDELSQSPQAGVGWTPVDSEPNWWTARHLARAVAASTRLWFMVTDRTGVVISLNCGAASILKVGAQVQSTLTHESATKLPSLLQTLGKNGVKTVLVVGHCSEGNLLNVEYEVWGYGDTLVWLGWPQGETSQLVGHIGDAGLQSLGMDSIVGMRTPESVEFGTGNDGDVDSLTGAWSRDRLERCVSTMCRQRMPFALVVVDINGLGNYNKSLGSDVGDSILKHVVTTLRSGLRESDAVVRLGGDECAIICPQATQVDALRLCLRLDQLVAATPLVIDGKQTLTVSVSMGWSCAPSDGDELSSLLVAADLRLYRMKSAAGK